MSLTLVKVGPVGCPVPSVRNNSSTPCKSPKKWRYQVDDCVLNLKCLIGGFIVGAHLWVVARETVGIV
jgi:hypothetical protein